MKVIQVFAFLCALLALQPTFADATDPNYDFGQVNLNSGVFEKEISATADAKNNADLFAFTLNTQSNASAPNISIPDVQAKFDQSVKSVVLLNAQHQAIGGDRHSLDSFNFSGLASGQYYLKGIVDNQHKNARAYKVTLTTNASPVPEPSTYAMMVAGLCLIVYAAGRRIS
jgi:hypothetical protein